MRWWPQFNASRFKRSNYPRYPHPIHCKDGLFKNVRTQPPVNTPSHAIRNGTSQISLCEHRCRNTKARTPNRQKEKDSLARAHRTSELDGLLVLELSPRSIRGPKTELVTVQLNFDVRAIQHSLRALCVGLAFTPATARFCTIQRDGEREDGPLLW